MASEEQTDIKAITVVFGCMVAFATIIGLHEEHQRTVNRQLLEDSMYEPIHSESRPLNADYMPNPDKPPIRVRRVEFDDKRILMDYQEYGLEYEQAFEEAMDNMDEEEIEDLLNNER